MDKCLYVAEGEIEQRFLAELKQLGYFVPGKFMKYNLMQKKVKHSDNIVAKKYTRLICIIDTDCVEATNLETFVHNLKMLKEICRNIEVMVQKENFEGELSWLLGNKSLLKAFATKFEGVKDLKQFLAQKVVYREVISKENAEEYCSRYQDFHATWQKRWGQAHKIKFAVGKDIMNK